MPNNRQQIDQIVAEAQRLLAQADDEGVPPQDILDAIQSVADQIKKKAGGDPAIASLVEQVQAISKQPPA